MALNSESGGIDLDAKKSIHITSNENNTDDAIKLNSKLGGIELTTKNDKLVHVTGGHAVQSTTNAALVVTGGVGVADSINVGGIGVYQIKS